MKSDYSRSSAKRTPIDANKVRFAIWVTCYVPYDGERIHWT